MHLNRRNLLKGMTASAGTALGSSIFPGISRAASIGSGGPKRVIFFMQNQGFDPATCIPAGMSSSGSLAKAKLPEPIERSNLIRSDCTSSTACTACTPAPRTAPSSARSAAIVAAMVCRPAADDRLRTEQGPAADASASSVHRHGLD